MHGGGRKMRRAPQGASCRCAAVVGGGYLGKMFCLWISMSSRTSLPSCMHSARMRAYPAAPSSSDKVSLSPVSPSDNWQRFRAAVCTREESGCLDEAEKRAIHARGQIRVGFAKSRPRLLIHEIKKVDQSFFYGTVLQKEHDFYPRFYEQLSWQSRMINLLPKMQVREESRRVPYYNHWLMTIQASGLEIV
jgi:hypothetical protein